MRVALLSVIALATGACGHGAEPTAGCTAVAGRMVAIARDALGATAVDAVTRQRVSDQLPAMHDAIEASCTNDHWGPGVRDCLAHAPDHAAFEACELQLTAAQRAGLDRAAGAAPASP